MAISSRARVAPPADRAAPAAAVVTSFLANCGSADDGAGAAAAQRATGSRLIDPRRPIAPNGSTPCFRSEIRRRRNGAAAPRADSRLVYDVRRDGRLKMVVRKVEAAMYKCVLAHSLRNAVTSTGSLRDIIRRRGIPCYFSSSKLVSCRRAAVAMIAGRTLASRCGTAIQPFRG